jgi:hypothetical protein
MMWSVIAWGLLLLGLSVLARGLLWDRAGFRGRAALRCRRCWYDLSNAQPQGAVVTCPECGKTHRSRRAMRKTRRSKRFIVAALVLFIAAYGVRSTPQVKKRGMWAAVPGWVLVLGIHQTPRYVQDPDVEWGAVAYGNNSMLERAMRELHVRSRMDGLGWLDYQLVAWLARTEGAEGLCVRSRDRKYGVYPRASSYRILIERGIGQGELGAFHDRWFRRLVDVRIETRAAWPEGFPVYGRPIITDAKDRYMKDPQLRVRLYTPISGTSVFSPAGPNPPRRLQELDGRAMRYFEEMGGMPAVLAQGAWDDGVIKLRPRDPSDNFADVQVTVSEFLGDSKSLGEPETVVDRYELSVPVSRVDDISSIATVISDEDVVSEIQRCVRADGYWWYDVDGCRRVVLALRLVENPSLVRRRYTFGNDNISAYRWRDSLSGHGWWAIEPDGDQGWRLIHGGKLVLMSGGGSEQSLGSSEYPWSIIIRSDPEYCLRDFAATHIVDARLRFEITWKRFPNNGM